MTNCTSTPTFNQIITFGVSNCDFEAQPVNAAKMREAAKAWFWPGKDTLYCKIRQNKNSMTLAVVFKINSEN